MSISTLKDKCVFIAFFVIFFSLIPQQTRSQMSTLDDLKVLRELQSQRAEEPLLKEDEIEDQEDNSIKTKIQIIESSSEFGYQGGNTFRNKPKPKELREGVVYFGYDYFTDAPATYAMLSNIPVQSNYIVGPGDNFKVIIYGSKNVQFTLEVTKDGDITIPEIGPLPLSGLTYQAAIDAIEKAVKSKMIGSEATASLGALRSINVFVLGEAFQPGMYTVSSLSTLTNAIFASGGIRTTGSLRNIQLKRNGEVISTFDFYDLLLKGDTSADARLKPGDVVFVPPITKTVGIAGEVRRPAIYELNEEENLDDLIEYAGSFNPKADFSSGTIERIDYQNGGYELIELELDENKNNFAIKDGDFLKVYSITDSMNGAILLSGHAEQPGFYPWQEGMLLKEVISSYQDLLPMTDLNYVLVKRKNDNDGFFTFFQIDIEKTLSKDNKDSFELLDQDELLFFPSLLSPELISTELIEEKYEIRDQQFDTSLTYLATSLDREKFITTIEYEEQQMEGQLSNADDLVATPTKSFYQYNIYDYCKLPQKIVRKALVTAGYMDSPENVSALQLRNITNQDELQILLSNIERENTKEQFDDVTLTKFCRDQIIKPFMDIILRQPSSSQAKRIVSVYGNVFFPGQYPLSEGMTLLDAINAAGGLKESSYSSEIEIIRNNKRGKEYDSRNLSFDSRNKNSLNQAVEAMDIINIKQLATEIRTVEVSGEVYFPGVYPISKNETLSQIIKRAGGFTNDASAIAASFTRESIREAELKRIGQAQAELRRSLILSSQKQGFGEQAGDISKLTDLLSGSDNINQSERIGRMVVDLEGIMENKVTDVTLEDGDKLHIPKRPQTISVIGEVYVPNAHLFRENTSLDEYVRLSGGKNEYADDDNIYLVKADGSIVSPGQLSSSGFFRGRADSLQPGDTIVVPLNLSTFSSIRATTEVTQIIYQMALAAAAVNSF
jgi:polysaccharide export outer membrane protein